MSEDSSAMATLRRIARPMRLKTGAGSLGESPAVGTVLTELNRRIAMAQAAISTSEREQGAREIDYEFWEMRRVTVFKPADGEFVIANASVGSCGLCGRPITGMGGQPNMICLSCGDQLLRGNLRTCVKWEEP